VKTLKLIASTGREAAEAEAAARHQASHPPEPLAALLKPEP
jgi:hypothetical protein